MQPAKMLATATSPDFGPNGKLLGDRLQRRAGRFEQWRFRHWLLLAAAWHVSIVIAIVLIGRARLLPDTFDSNGLGVSFASDGVLYLREMVTLSEILYSRGPIAWMGAASQTHLLLLSLPFALVSPIVGRSILGVEPLNLLCYLAILSFVFKLGCEVFDRRSALWATAAVAVWPSLLLYTTQLQRDPLFLAAMLGLVFVNTTWLTRFYTWRAAVGAAVLGIAATILVWVTKFTMWPIMVVMGFFAMGCLIACQIYRRNLLPANMMAITVLLVATLLLPRCIPRINILSVSESADASLAKEQVAVARASEQTPATADDSDNESSYDGLSGDAGSGSSDAPFDAARPGALRGKSRNSRHKLRPRKAALAYRSKALGELTLAERINNQRIGFVVTYAAAGSNIDADVQFESTGDIIAYLPRALQIGLCAPFPNTWFDSGGLTGRLGRVVAAVEMVMIYGFEAMALLAVWRERRRLPMWFLLFFAALGVTTLSLIVANVGTLYRMRYVFWIMLIIVGARGAVLLFSSSASRLAIRKKLESPHMATQE